MTYLKDYQEYADQYDEITVAHCRRMEIPRKTKTEAELPEGVTKEQAQKMDKFVRDWFMRFETGERYLNKSKTIKEWMDRDRKRDELLETAVAPENIRCLTCRNRVEPNHKHLEIGIDDKEEDRVLFMYDCPNQCLPHRAFYSDGKEYRVKPNLCPKCSAPFDSKVEKRDNKLITTNTCPECRHVEVDEMDFSKPEEKVDEHFARDRDRFCLTDEEGQKYQDEKWRMERLAELGKEFEEKEKARAKKLKKNPKGFHLEGAGYTCFICGDHTPEGDNWYDKWGIKCLVCQKAIDNKEIPASLAKNKDSWYSEFEMAYYFNVKTPTIKKWLRENIIKARTVSKYGKGVHVQLFLIKDNKNFLPPKKMVESQSVTTKKDDKTWHSSEKWYKFVDPHEHLKGYKIMDYLQVTKEEK